MPGWGSVGRTAASRSPGVASASTTTAIRASSSARAIAIDRSMPDYDCRMLENVVAAAFALAVVVAAVAVGFAAVGRTRSHPLVLVAGVLGAASAAAWIAFAFEPTLEVALGAAGPATA